MKIRIDFIGMPRSEAFAKTFEKRLSMLQRKFSGHRRDEAVLVHARFIATAHTPQGSLKEVEAEIQIKIPRRKDIVVCRKGRDLKLLAVEVVAAAESQVRHDVKKRSRGKSRERDIPASSDL
jgi:hypothetical protein